METNSEGLTLNEWLCEVDKVILSKVGLTHADLADFPIYDMWSDGFTPCEAAWECCITWNDMPEDLFEGEF